MSYWLRLSPSFNEGKSLFWSCNPCPLHPSFVMIYFARAQVEEAMLVALEFRLAASTTFDFLQVRQSDGRCALRSWQ